MVRRAWEWWRSKKPLIDFFFMLPIGVLTVLSAPNFVDGPGRREIPELHYALISAGLLLPLIFRRRWPLAVFAAIAAVAGVQWLAGHTMFVADVAVMVALYTVAADRRLRWGVTAALIAEAGAVMESCRHGGDAEARRGLALMLTVGIGGVWCLGMYINTRRAYLRSVEERAARLERERDTQVRIATAAERARIARDMHDVVAHNVSVIVVQADGASYAIDTDVERTRRALETISSTGRLALAEMRRLLGVLREGDDAGSYAPQPGVEQLTDLVEQVRSAGLPLDFEVEGVPPAMPEGLQLTIFRVVQEALTNTMKHGGPAVTARVRLRYGDGAIEVLVVDDGRGAAAANDGQGHGLVGMRERVAVYDGSVRAGPRAGGGFEVVARLPVREETRV